MYLVDYHLHPYSHGEKKYYNEKLLHGFIEFGLKRGIKEIGFSDHEEYDKKIKWNDIDSLKEKSPVPIRKALEFDYIPGREKEIANKITKYKLDYSIGSVHFIGNWGFDNPSNILDYNNKDIDMCYIKYFDLVKKAIKSNLFNIIGHFDLIKLFGYRPENLDIMDIVKPILRNIKKYDLVLEINTNGLNKPVKEIYPSLEIIERAYQFKIPITFGSDAHQANRVGENIKNYVEVINKIGYKEVAVFEKRQLKFKSL